MRITVIGSSHGVPEPGRKCACFLLEAGENVYFVDMGTDGIQALRDRGIPVEAVKGIFITHVHGDHVNGLIPFVDLITWYVRAADPVICLPDLSLGAVIDRWLEVTLNGCQKKIRYQKTEPGVVYDDGVLKVTAIPTEHCPDSFAFLVEGEGKRVLFTGDLRNPGKDFPVSALEEKPDLLICESAHFEATDYLPVLEGGEVGRVCVSHYSDRYLGSVLTLCDDLNGRGIPACRATDGLVLTV